jgi:hypothetical protein
LRDYRTLILPSSELKLLPTQREEHRIPIEFGALDIKALASLRLQISGNAESSENHFFKLWTSSRLNPICRKMAPIGAIGPFSLSIALKRDPVTPLPIMQGTRAEAHA